MLETSLHGQFIPGEPSTLMLFATLVHLSCNWKHYDSEVRASQLAQASERVGSLIPASQQG